MFSTKVYLADADRFTGDAEDEDEEDYEAESSDDDAEEDINMVEEPGKDSGCTAVVALLKGMFLPVQFIVDAVLMILH